jgi:hypothetical protein
MMRSRSVTRRLAVQNPLKIAQENIALRERAEQAERALMAAQAGHGDTEITTRHVHGLRVQLAQAQTDLVGAEATAETLRLALAEAEQARDAARISRDAMYGQLCQLRATLASGNNSAISAGEAKQLATTIMTLHEQLAQAEQRGRALEGALQWLWWTACHVEVEPVDEKWGTDVRPRTLSEIMTERERAEIRAALTPAEGSA